MAQKTANLSMMNRNRDSVADKFSLLSHAGCYWKGFGDDKSICSFAEDVGAKKACETNTGEKYNRL